MPEYPAYGNGGSSGGSGGSGNYIPLAGNVAISPSGDITGAVDINALTAACAQFGATVTGSAGSYVVTGGSGIIYLQAGTYWGVLPKFDGSKISILGPYNKDLCSWKAPSGTAGTSGAQKSIVEVTDSSFTGAESSFLWLGFTIDGTGCGQYTSGARIGDHIGVEIHNVLIKDFTGTGAKGWDFLNQHGWMEQADLTIWAINNTLGFSFDSISPGTNSFDYGGRFRMTINAAANQNGWYFGTANLIGSEMVCVGNMAVSSANTSVAFTVAAGAQLQQCEFRGVLECDGATGVGPVTFACTTGAQLEMQGRIAFKNAGWTASTGITAGMFTFSGMMLMPSTETWFPTGSSFWADGVQIVAPAPFIAGSWYPNYAISPGTMALVTGKIYAYPFVVTRQHTFQNIGVWCTAGGTAAVCRFGIYNDNGGTPVGGTLVSDLGAAGNATTAAVITKAAAVTLNPGTYWLAVAQNSATGACTVNSDTSQRLSGLFGQSAITASQGENTGFASTASTTTGALPTPFPAASQANPVPYLLLQA